jgi:hypothetical protein
MPKNSFIPKAYKFVRKLWRSYLRATRPLSKEDEDDWQPFGM